MTAADDLLGLSWAADIVIVTADDPGSMPSADALRLATDVVVAGPSRRRAPREQDAVERLGIRPLRVESSATAEDIALLLAERENAALIVGVGLHARLEDFLDNQMAGRASTFATRLKVGSRLVDARAVEALYSSRTQTRLRAARRAGRPGRPRRGDRDHPGRPGVDRRAGRPRRLPQGAVLVPP